MPWESLGNVDAESRNSGQGSDGDGARDAGQPVQRTVPAQGRGAAPLCRAGLAEMCHADQGTDVP